VLVVKLYEESDPDVYASFFGQPRAMVRLVATLMLIAILAAPALSPIQLEAERIDVIRQAPKCGHGYVTFTKLKAQASPGVAQIEQGSLCTRSGFFHLTGLKLQLGRLFLQATEAKGTVSHAQLQSAQLGPGLVTACGCHKAPWSIRFQRAELDGTDGVWLHWPILMAHSTPVLAFPIWYISSNQRQSRLLWPRIGWRANEGLTATIPFFWALTPKHDVTAEFGFRGTDSQMGALRLGWSAETQPTNHLQLSVVDDVRHGQGHGVGRLGPVSLVTHMDWLSDVRQREKSLNDWLEGHRSHWSSALSASVGNAHGLIGASTWLDQAKTPALGDPWSLANEIYGDWQLVTRPVSVVVSTQLRELNRAGQADYQIELDADISGIHWLGPLRTRWSSSAWLGREWPESDGSKDTQRFYGAVNLEVSLGLHKYFRQVRHEIRFGLDGNWAGLKSTDSPLTDSLYADDFKRTRAGGFISQTLQSPRTTTHLKLLQWVDVSSTDAALAPFESNLEHHSPYLQLAGESRGYSWAWLEAQSATEHGLSIGVHGVYVQGNEIQYWRDQVRRRPMYRLDQTYGEAKGLGPSAHLKLGPLSMGGALLFAHWRGQFLGYRAHAIWRGSCQCWHGKITLNQGQDHPYPNVIVSFGLVPEGHH
jgi:hypothetical protein